MKIVKESLKDKLKGPSKEEVRSKLIQKYPTVEDPIDDLKELGYNFDIQETALDFIEFTLYKGKYDILIRYIPPKASWTWRAPWEIRVLINNLAYRGPIDSYFWEEAKEELIKLFKEI